MLSASEAGISIGKKRSYTVCELLEDPIVIAVMARDGISPDSVQQLFERLRRSRRVQEERLAA